jgi:hypothetical protein
MIDWPTTTIMALKPQKGSFMFEEEVVLLENPFNNIMIQLSYVEQKYYFLHKQFKLS